MKVPGLPTAGAQTSESLAATALGELSAPVKLRPRSHRHRRIAAFTCAADSGAVCGVRPPKRSSSVRLELGLPFCHLSMACATRARTLERLKVLISSLRAACSGGIGFAAFKSQRPGSYSRYHGPISAVCNIRNGPRKSGDHRGAAIKPMRATAQTGPHLSPIIKNNCSRFIAAQ